MLHRVEMDVADHPRAIVRARVFVLTVSDTRIEASDRSGALCRELVTAAGHEVVGRRIVRDEPTEVAALLRVIADDRSADVVVSSGGTGITARDSTYEAVAGLLEKRMDGFGELFRMLSYQEIGPRAMLSRAVAGLYRGVVLFAIPGSTAAVRLALEKLIAPVLGHVVHEARR